MEIIKANNWSDLSPSDWQSIYSHFRKGGVVVYPTDTIYGLGCLASSQSAIDIINSIKGRSEDKGLLVLMGDLEMVAKYCDVSLCRDDIENIWNEERSTSIILPYHNGLAPDLTGKNEGLAVRLPKDAFLRKMINEIGEPIVSTSVNQSGQAPILSGEEIIEFFGNGQLAPDLIIDLGVAHDLRPSRLISLISPNKPKVIRE